MTGDNSNMQTFVACDAQQCSAVVPVAIIGYGTAGVNAAIAMRNAGYTGEIVAFSDTDCLPYSPILTSYYVGGEKTYEQCFPWSADELDQLNVQVVREGKVVQLDPNDHRIVTQQGGAYTYQKCLIAVGAHPTTVGFPADCGYEPLVLRTLDDAKRMKAAFERPDCKRVLVSGASMIALKCVEAALNNGLEVSLVGMNDHILDFSALPETAQRFERGLAAKGVHMRFGQTIAQVEVLQGAGKSDAEAYNAQDADSADATATAETGDAEESNRILEVHFSGGDVECFDEIVVAHGVRSDTSFIQPGSIDVDQAILVDDFMRTSNADVYAAGDVAQALELITGEKHVLGIWKTAALQGACSGRAIAAELAGQPLQQSDAYQGAIMTNTIAVNGTLFISAGVAQANSQQRVEISETDTMTVACIYQLDNAAQVNDASCANSPAPTSGVDSEDAIPTAPASGEHLVGFNVASDVDVPGGVAYDTAAMLSLRIEAACKR